MFKYKQLVKAYEKARKYTRNSKEVAIYESNLEANLMKLLRALNDRTWRATSFYFFIVTRPKPREICASVFDIRIVHHLVDELIRPIMDEVLPLRTFNNRLGFGVTAAIDQLIDDMYEITNGYTETAYIRKIDLSSCFPTASCDEAYKVLMEVCDVYEGKDKEDLRWLIGRCIYAYPQTHFEWRGDLTLRKLVPRNKTLSAQVEGIGLPIGSLLSQDVIALLVNKALKETYRAEGFRTINFVDDTVTLCKYKEPLLYTIPELRKSFRSVGLKINESKFYLQETRKGVEFLGVHIRNGRIHPNRRTVRNMYKDIERWNKTREKYLHAENFCQCVNSFLSIFKRTTAQIEFNRAITAIEPV